MTNKPEHTALPWKQYGSEIWQDDTTFIAKVASERIGSREANAAFIVRACNSHYELVEALSNFITEGGWRGMNGTQELFECEYCHALNEDSSIERMGHLEKCPITIGKAALAKARGEA